MTERKGESEVSMKFPCPAKIYQYGILPISTSCCFLFSSMPRFGIQLRHGNYYACETEGCTYRGLRYQVRAHYLKQHLGLKDIPYFCTTCCTKWATKELADKHLVLKHGHDSFRELFTGCYQDLKIEDIPMKRMNDDETHGEISQAISSKKRKADPTEADLQDLYHQENKVSKAANVVIPPIPKVNDAGVTAPLSIDSTLDAPDPVVTMVQPVPDAVEPEVIIETIQLLVENADGTLTELPMPATIIHQEKAEGDTRVIVEKGTLTNDPASSDGEASSSEDENSSEEGDTKADEEPEAACAQQGDLSATNMAEQAAHAPEGNTTSSTNPAAPIVVGLKPLIDAILTLNTTLSEAMEVAKDTKSYIRRMCHAMEEQANMAKQQANEAKQQSRRDKENKEIKETITKSDDRDGSHRRGHKSSATPGNTRSRFIRA